MTSLIDLAERIEAAEGPDRELGREVLRACGWKQSGHGYFLGPLTGWTSPDGKTWFDDDAFARHDPTASIDAALTLVPEGWAYRIENWPRPEDQVDIASSETRRAKATVMECFVKRIGRSNIWGFHTPGSASAESRAATPALALCAAALRAHAVKGEE